MEILTFFSMVVLLVGADSQWKKLGDYKASYRISQSMQNACRVDFKSRDGEKGQTIVAELMVAINRSVPKGPARQREPGESEPTEVREQLVKRELVVHLSPFGMESRELSDCFGIRSVEVPASQIAK